VGTQGPTREQDGEIDFSADELSDMKVEVAGREETTAARRKKRALRVPADEVPRSSTTAITTEPDLEALAPVVNEEADQLVDHAFSNGGRAEAEVSAQRAFAQVDAPSSVVDGDEDLEPELTIENRGRARPDGMVGAIARMPPNLRALVRAVVPAQPSRKLESGEVEQLDSDELEVMDKEQSAATALAPATAPVAPPSVPAVERTDPQQAALDAVEELSSDAAEESDEDEEVAADDMTLDEAEDEPRARTLPPATPAAAAPRARSITPVMPVPAYTGSIAPATAPLTPPPPPQSEAEGGLRPRRRRRAKQWFEEIFDDDYLRTLPFLSPKQTEREAAFIADSLELPAGAAVLDLGCGYGRHAMELANRGHQVTGLDLSLPLLIRAADAARRLGVAVNFVHGDMREMSFDAEFDAAYCVFTSFGYFDDDTNRKVAANLQRALKPGGKVLIELVNRDYITRDLPTRVWWQGEGCVVLEEVDFNYFSSRLQVQRSIILEDGRQLEQEISIRAYSLHEIGKVLHHAGFRVIEVSGGLGLRGKFFGAHSRQLLVLAEKKAP